MHTAKCGFRGSPLCCGVKGWELEVPKAILLYSSGKEGRKDSVTLGWSPCTLDPGTYDLSLAVKLSGQQVPFCVCTRQIGFLSIMMDWFKVHLQREGRVGEGKANHSFLQCECGDSSALQSSNQTAFPSL